MTESALHTRKDEAAPTKAKGVSGRAIALATFSVTVSSAVSTVAVLKVQYDSLGILAGVVLFALGNLLSIYTVIFNMAQAPDFPNGIFKPNAKLKLLILALFVFAVVFASYEILGR